MRSYGKLRCWWRVPCVRHERNAYGRHADACFLEPSLFGIDRRREELVPDSLPRVRLLQPPPAPARTCISPPMRLWLRGVVSRLARSGVASFQDTVHFRTSNMLKKVSCMTFRLLHPAPRRSREQTQGIRRARDPYGSSLWHVF